MILPGTLQDSHGRVMRDLRISLTDRCNFRCIYCLPETEAAANFYKTRFHSQHNPHPSSLIPMVWKPRNELLTFEEIFRLTTIFTDLGIRKIRLTGGEPLLRQDLEKLVKNLATLPAIEDLALTTNGFLWSQKGDLLKEAGLKRVTFSLDSLNRENFKKITGRDGLVQVLRAIDHAQKIGFEPVKVNAVIIKSLNDHEIEGLAQFALNHQLPLRFIEFMPLDSKKAWQREMVMPGKEIFERIQKHFKLEQISETNPSETARRWRIEGSQAEIGIIAPVTEPFCGHCNRLRLTAEGKIRTCLFSQEDHDLRGLLRNNATNEVIIQEVKRIVLGKEASHRLNEPDFIPPERSMSCIGG